MIFFITFLRALAACLITNAHYTGIYPNDIIANGGLIGDVLFFAVSGYCLYNIKTDLSFSGFVRWYGRRIWRVYPPVILATVVYMLLGAYSLVDHSFIWWYIFPTYYHFIASIIILYVPFFLLIKIVFFRQRLIYIMIAIALVWLILYFTVYDKSSYHIDNVHEPMIRFLFMESMLLGAWFRQNDNKFRNRLKIIYPLFAVLFFAAYFASKVFFSKKPAFSSFQFVNQIAIFVLLFFLFVSFAGLDDKLNKLPLWLKRIVSSISKITLEIYVVQYVLIDLIREINIAFPINWIILTAVILAAAITLHLICKLLYSLVDKTIMKVKS